MSPQVIELLVFAAIALWVINKLISILGNTNEADLRSKKSYFGEGVRVKEVQGLTSDVINEIEVKAKDEFYRDITDYLESPKDKALLDNVVEVIKKVDKFTPKKFLNNVVKAWVLIIEYVQKNDSHNLGLLVDKRYISTILNNKDHYLNIDVNKVPQVKISEVTFFGNDVIIKVAVMLGLQPIENWSFTRHLNQNSPNWFLSNIDNNI